MFEKSDSATPLSISLNAPQTDEEEGVLARAQNITQQSSDSIFVFKVDNRVRTLLENGLKLKQRTFLIIVGDHGREQVCFETHAEPFLLRHERRATRPASSSTDHSRGEPRRDSPTHSCYSCCRW